jgi:uncharacterized protein (TIGR02246 family)
MRTADSHQVEVHEISSVLDDWKSGIATRNLNAIADVFTPEALFQGMRPTFTIGRDGVKEYYGAKPPGLSVEYEVLNLRQLGDDAVIAYVGATFHRADGGILRTRITTVLSRAEERWLIDHYHVSALQ